MSDYSNTFGAATKDATNATIYASDINTELNSISTAIGTKANKAVPLSVGNVATLSISGDLVDAGVGLTAYTKTILDDADAGAVKDTLLLSTAVTITPGSNADVTLSTTEATYGRLKLVDGSWITGHNIIVPTNQRRYLIDNSVGNYTATIKTAAGTGVAVYAGTNKEVVCDGTNVIDPMTAFPPPGSVIWYAASTAPYGYLKADGTAVSRTTYLALFTAIGTTFGVGDGSTTFNLPDLRGEFIRGYDDGKGTDSGRVFGSSQADQNQAHTHTFGVYNAVADDNHPYTGTGSQVGTVTTSSSGGAEARPRNIALLACIKY